MNLNHPKTKGTIAEQFIIANLLSLGYDVSTPVGDNLKYDLIVDNKGKLYRVQARVGRLVNGAIYITTASTRLNSKGFYKNTYSEKDIDFFAVYYGEDVYIIPIEECSGKKQKCLRIEETKNKQVNKVYWAKDYLLSESSFD